MEDLDYLVVGAGLFGAVFAQEASKQGKKVLVIDKRNHIARGCGTMYSAFPPSIVSRILLLRIIKERSILSPSICIPSTRCGEW